MRIEIQDFGPIREGAFTLKPLTVFIGPNNSGKSYMATLAYALRNAESQLSRLRFATPENPEVEFQNWLARELERCFGSELSSLVRAGAPASHVVFLGDEARLVFDLTAGNNELDLRSLVPPLDRAARALLAGEGQVPLSSFFQNLFGVERHSHYLPAARSGILQGYKVLAGAIVSQMPLVGLRPIEIPRLSGVVADFIGKLLQLEKQRADGAAVGEFLEKELCGGAIELEKETKSQSPEIVYHYRNLKLPVHRTSSMISETAPIVLFLKHVVRRGNLLIIEEPEAHLHPAAQLIMARGLARTVRAGVNVLITTHSDYLVHQISNLILLSSVPQPKRSELQYDEQECLKADEVAAYLFECTNEGSVIRELQVTPTDGIPEQEFLKIAEAIYDETVDLERHGASTHEPL